MGAATAIDTSITIVNTIPMIPIASIIIYHSACSLNHIPALVCMRQVGGVLHCA